MASAEELVRRLEDPEGSARDRENAAAELVELCRRDEEARARYLLRFATLLSDEAPMVRGWAIVGVALCDEDLEHVGRIVRLMEDPSPGIRLQAVHALGPLADPGLADDFAARLADPDRLVRMAAAVALAALRDPRGAEELMAAAQRRRTRLEALAALRRIASLEGVDRKAIEAVAWRLYGGVLSSRFDKLEAAGLLTALGEAEGGHHLLERARKGKLERPMAIEMLGEYRVEGAEPLLVAIASDAKDPFRGAALRALGSHASERALDLCSEALRREGEDADLRCDAAEGLLLLGGERAEEELRWASEHAGEGRVRRIAGICLRLFGKPADEVRPYLPLTGDEVIS